MNVRLLLMLVFGLTSAAFAGGKDTTNAKIPDPEYVAERGDEAYLVLYDRQKHELLPVFCALYSFAYEKYWRALSIKDYEETVDLIDRKSGYFVDNGVAVRVLELETFPAGDPRPTCAICRILDGSHRGEKVWVARFNVGRPIPNPDYMPRR